MLGGKHERTRFDEGFGFVLGSWFHIKDGVNYSNTHNSSSPFAFFLCPESGEQGYVNQAF